MDSSGMQESHSIESVRKMLLLQEEIFKHQVHELHRLYNLQKHLMQELENGLIRHRKAKTAHIDAAVQLTFSSARPHQQSGHDTNSQDFITRGDPKEMSVSCSGDHNNRSGVLPIKLGLAMPAESTSTDEKDLKRIEEGNVVEVELTLTVGMKRSKNQSDRDPEQLGHSSRKTSNGDECGESGFYHEKTWPPWLLQDLSLHRR